MPCFEPEGILFDLDGVLIDSTPSVTRVWHRWAEEHGYDPATVIHVAHGRRAIETVEYFAPHLDSAAELLEIERRELADTEGLTVFAGVRELLRTLPDDLWTVVTSGTRALARKRLSVGGLPVPSHLVSADDVSQGKPHPAPFLKGAEKLGLAPDRCVVVEDSPSGIRSAHAAGIKAIAVPTTYSSEELHEADVLLTSFAQLRAELLGKNGNRRLRLCW